MVASCFIIHLDSWFKFFTSPKHLHQHVLHVFLTTYAILEVGILIETLALFQNNVSGFSLP